MKNFAAIDFETANYASCSVCSVGIVIVEDGQIADSIYHLIRPYPNYYIPQFIYIHGITYSDTMNAKKFPNVWAEIAPKIVGLPLVAHNSSFDEGCLRAVHSFYKMDYPDYKFYCTYRASRKIYGKTLPNYQLHTVAAHCGYDLTNHHNALADAEACAHIAMQIIEDV
ncbi:MAG: 3'-5' exonuclease [Ignavibacteria bacterium]|jgi:DNA polymerase-3 subunit epsilon|nr:3'-5' exonuclease [Ignavibacteria bacterium]